VGSLSNGEDFMVMEVTEPDNISIVVSEKRENTLNRLSNRSHNQSSSRKDNELKQVIISELSLQQIESEASDLEIENSASESDKDPIEKLKTVRIPE
jgi:hypothetical protein